jgi:LmbE family N-acetylglucosaminyl deacetylase
VHLYLSPHLDDAVLSCGGLIHRQVRTPSEPPAEPGAQALSEPSAEPGVLVLTVFAGDPPPGPRSEFAELLGQLWGAPENPMAVRRAEDRAALERLGAAWLHWEYPDAVYRTAPGGEFCYPSREAIFGDVHPAERTALVEELSARLVALCRERRPAVVYSLLTAGHHVDHQLLQWAARALEREWPVRHYEDYPYVEDASSLQAALELAGGAWQAELEPLAEADLEARLDAVACYESQLDVLFAGEAAMRERLSAYARSLGVAGPAERYWRREAGR